jgi:hypothetical protein
MRFSILLPIAALFYTAEACVRVRGVSYITRPSDSDPYTGRVNLYEAERLVCSFVGQNDLNGHAGQYLLNCEDGYSANMDPYFSAMNYATRNPDGTWRTGMRFALDGSNSGAGPGVFAPFPGGYAWAYKADVYGC